MESWYNCDEIVRVINEDGGYRAREPKKELLPKLQYCWPHLIYLPTINVVPTQGKTRKSTSVVLTTYTH